MTKKESPKEKTGNLAMTLDRRGDNLDTRLLDLAFEPVMVRTFKGEITYWNKGAAALYGYSQEEALGAQSHDLLKTVFSVPLADIERQLEREGSWLGELIHTSKVGRKIIVESRHQLFDLEDGKKLVLETNRDITARETQYRTLFEGMQEGACFCRMFYDKHGQPTDWVYLDVNPTLEKILGIPGMIGQRNSELFPGMNESNPELLEIFGRVTKTGMPAKFESYLHGPDIWAYLSAFSPARDHFIVIGKDINKRKQAEEALKQSESRFRSFFENAAIGAAQIDRQGRFIHVNNRMSQITGYTRNELMHMGPLDLDHPDDVEADRQHIENFFSSNEPYLFYEKRYVHKAGHVVWVRVTVAPVRDEAGDLVTTAALIEDITERKNAEIELKRVKAHLEHLLNAGPAVIFSCKPDGDFGATFISDNITRQLGYTPDEFMNHSGFWSEHLHPEDAPRVFANLPKLFETGRHTHEYRFMHKEGTYRWMLDELRLVKDNDGKPLEIIGAWHDITGLKLTEDELRESEQSLRLALDAARMGMWDWNLDTDALWWDEREHELFGIPAEQFSGFAAEAFERMHPDDREKAKKAVMDAISGGGLFDTEFRVIHPDGSIHWLAGRGQIVAAGVNRMMGVNYDITELKQTEHERDKYTRMENLAQMHRLQVAGEFAALLAHQLNQPLTAIRSFAEAGIARLRRGKMEPEQVRETLQDVVAQSERAAGSIRDLRKFLARQPMEMVTGDINAEVNAACLLMDVLARGRKIKTTKKLAKDLPSVSMRPSQIEQIIVNLMENAMDAINHDNPKGGAIDISTRLDESKGEIIVGIQDSGPGLDDKTVGLVFDPLYTTKKNGIGMGLAISRSIIADHGGRIWAEPGPGGRFFFTLPVQK